MKKNQRKEPKKILSSGSSPNCDYCKSSVSYMGFSKCVDCGQYLCGYHTKPEQHNCQEKQKENRELKRAKHLLEFKEDLNAERRLNPSGNGCEYKPANFHEGLIKICKDCDMRLCAQHYNTYAHECAAVDWEYENKKNAEEQKRFIESQNQEFQARMQKNALEKSPVKFAWVFLLIILVLLLIGIVVLKLYDIDQTPSFESCFDNTTSNTCSLNKPFLCVNGNLVYDAKGCGCPEGQVLDNETCRVLKSCTDGTRNNNCSKNKPLFCYDGELFNNITRCGCPEGYINDAGTCRKINNCSDGTVDLDCSDTLPLLCYNGSLVLQASKCGCSPPLIPSGEDCFNPYSPDTTINYIWLHDDWNNITLNLSSKLDKYYENVSYAITCPPICTEEEYYRFMIFYGGQQQAIDSIISQVNGNNSDDGLLTTLGLVESLPYDYDKLESIQSGKNEGVFFPYQTLYHKTGVCSDKSLLGAAVVTRLGYGVALFSYEQANHMAIGIKCPKNLSNYNSGYCFLDMVDRCSHLTDTSGEYLSDLNGETTVLDSNPTIIVISDGKELQESTVMSDIDAYYTYQSAYYNLTKLNQVLSDIETEMYYATTTSEYNSLARYYNSKINEYNRYVNITEEYEYCSS